MFASRIFDDIEVPIIIIVLATQELWRNIISICHGNSLFDNTVTESD